MVGLRGEVGERKRGEAFCSRFDPAIAKFV